MRSRRRNGRLYIFVIAAMLGLFAAEVRAEGEGDASEARATTVSFHGYLEANVVLRDENGIQNGFLDHLNGVQQRNTLKFDVSVEPDLKWGDFAFSKFQMTYRGAYDSIYDMRANKFGDISEKGGPTRFDYGLRDVRFENDLREVFVDFTYNGPAGSAFFRPGRQEVSWGESSASATLLDVINPADNSYQLFFANPDDVKTPIWMARLNYSIPPVAGFKLNFDLLWVPDIRPTQFAPLDSIAGNPTAGMKAPYASILFSGLRGLNVRQDVPTEKQEYGAKVTADMGLLSVSAAYYRDVNNDPGVVIQPATGTALFTHGVQDVYGAYFGYQVTALDLVLRGEIAQHSAEPISLSGVDFLPNGDMATFRMKPLTQYMLAIDKSMWVPFITSHERTSFAFEWIHKTINDWEAAFDAGSAVKNMDIFGFSMSWSWFAGRISPVIAAAYIPGRPGAGGGTGYIHPIVSWQISPHLYSSFSLHAFLGDKTAKTGYAGLIETSEATLKIGYDW